MHDLAGLRSLSLTLTKSQKFKFPSLLSLSSLFSISAISSLSAVMFKLFYLSSFTKKQKRGTI